jgi:hypothetical protein
MVTKISLSAGALAVGLSSLGGCVTAPTGPSVAVMPAPGVPFSRFRADDYECRAYAAQSIGVSTNDAGAQNLAGSALVGSALGAVAGAALGGHSGAATGAGVGLITGTVYGTGLASEAQYGSQRRYDIAYEQCMYAKGNQLPTASSYSYYRPNTVVVAPSGSGYYYPPAAYPPPPP